MRAGVDQVTTSQLDNNNSPQNLSAELADLANTISQIEDIQLQPTYLNEEEIKQLLPSLHRESPIHTISFYKNTHETAAIEINFEDGKSSLYSLYKLSEVSPNTIYLQGANRFSSSLYKVKDKEFPPYPLIILENKLQVHPEYERLLHVQQRVAAKTNSFITRYDDLAKNRDTKHTGKMKKKMHALIQEFFAGYNQGSRHIGVVPPINPRSGIANAFKRYTGTSFTFCDGYGNDCREEPYYNCYTFVIYYILSVNGFASPITTKELINSYSSLHPREGEFGHFLELCTDLVTEKIIEKQGNTYDGKNCKDIFEGNNQKNTGNIVVIYGYYTDKGGVEKRIPIHTGICLDGRSTPLLSKLGLNNGIASADAETLINYFANMPLRNSNGEVAYPQIGFTNSRDHVSVAIYSFNPTKINNLVSSFEEK